jgi:hypothetical protein
MTIEVRGVTPLIQVSMYRPGFDLCFHWPVE